MEEDSLILIDQSKKKILLSRFKSTTEMEYIEAKHSIISTTSEIPYWMFIIVIILGWNEFMAVLRNPLYFLLIIVLGGLIYILYRYDLIQPVIKFSQTLLMEVGHKIIERIAKIENQKILDEKYEMYKQRYSTLQYADFDNEELGTNNNNVNKHKVKRYAYSTYCGPTNNSNSKKNETHGITHHSSLTHLNDEKKYMLNDLYNSDMDTTKKNNEDIKKEMLKKRHTYNVAIRKNSIDDENYSISNDSNEEIEMDFLKDYENKNKIQSKINAIQSNTHKNFEEEDSCENEYFDTN